LLNNFSNRRRSRATLVHAAEMLRDRNLIWSSDMEAIRIPLASLFSYEAQFETINRPTILKIAERVIDDGVTVA